MANTATEVALTNALNKTDVEYETLYDETDNDTDNLMSHMFLKGYHLEAKTAPKN